MAKKVLEQDDTQSTKIEKIPKKEKTISKEKTSLKEKTPLQEKTSLKENTPLKEKTPLKKIEKEVPVQSTDNLMEEDMPVQPTDQLMEEADKLMKKADRLMELADDLMEEDLPVQPTEKEYKQFLKDVKRSKIPVTVLTGFLGSGKTTLLNYILSANHGKKIAVIENEFGEVGVDDQLVNKKIMDAEQIIVMSNGCICCTVRGDLIKTLKELIYKLEKFDYILIETTGLADPAPVAQTFFVDPEIYELYRLDAIITVVDAKHIEMHLDDIKAEGVENESQEQIAFADRILLNKIDLVTPEDLVRIKGKIRAVNSVVEIIETQNSVIDLNKILDIKGFNLETILKMEPDFLKDDEHQHDTTISSVGLKFEGDINNFLFENFVQDYVMKNQTDLFRYKGVISIKGMRRKQIFQGIHMLFKIDEIDEEWGSQKRENRICFIGRNLDKEFITAEIMKCVINKDEQLRFKIGDEVECNCGGMWKYGIVESLWKYGNPYRVEPDNEPDIYVPLDHDDFVRPYIKQAGCTEDQCSGCSE